MHAVVSVWEFTIGKSKPETETLYGQQVERCRAVLDSYNKRQLVVAVNFTLKTLEVMTAHRQLQASNDMRLSMTGQQQFSISKTSPGFLLLIQLLPTTKAYLGYATLLMPAVKTLGRHSLEVQYLEY